uniref:Uncharacterized protein n=2 Tax=Vibrionaceae TaxID=641 RepID=A0A0H3ZXN1_VIBSP|nr:hypothetical protein [Vibrio splendidus]AKN40535.1 hypothetical protein [Enterovibrio norvegicus]
MIYMLCTLSAGITRIMLQANHLQAILVPNMYGKPTMSKSLAHPCLTF